MKFLNSFGKKKLYTAIYLFFLAFVVEEIGLDEKGNLTGLRDHDTASTERTQTDGNQCPLTFPTITSCLNANLL